MFMGCTGLKSLPSGLLPSTSLAFGCYAKMFSGCSNIASVPANLLPATTLAKGCYHCMFARCSSLVKAPELPATEPQPGCYFTMFRWCSKLTEVKCMLYFASEDQSKPSEVSSDAAEQEVNLMSNWTTINRWSVFNKWLNSVKAGGTLYKNPSMNYKKTDGANNVGEVLNSWTITNWE